jgi:putative DNA methylase
MSISMKHSIIEDASIDLLDLFDQVGKEAKIEKNAVPPINKMIYWWTRKPLIVGRLVTLASTLDNVKDVKSLLGLDSRNRAYQYVPEISTYSKIGKLDPKNIKLLDPFAGAGSLAFPAVQLGLDVTVSDYNPLAHIIEKSILDFPSKYDSSLLVDVEKYAKLVIEKTEMDVGKFFKQNHLVYLWCWCITCPHCTQRVPLANQMYIVNTPKNKIGVRFIPKDKNFTVEINKKISDLEGKKYTQKGGNAICISCKNSIDYKTLTKDISKNKDREMIVIQIQKTTGREYVIPTEEDKKIYENAKKYYDEHKQIFEEEHIIPNELIPHDSRSPLKNYGIIKWDEFFDHRQLLVLCTFLRNIKKICDQIEDKEYRGVIATYLGVILAKRVNMAGLGMVWQGSREIPQYVLLLRWPRLVYNFAESNPFVKVTGGFQSILGNVLKGISFANRTQNTVKCKLESVTAQTNSQYDIILTDPPYGDDVQYGELSSFFYVWVYRALKTYFPELPLQVPLDEDFCVSVGRFGNKTLAIDFFEKGLKKSFTSMNEKLKDDGLLVVFFAHSSTKAWNLFLESIRESNFKVISSYAIHTENTSNVIAKGKTSFMSSIVVVCRKILEPSEEYFEDIIPKIEDKIKLMLKQIPNEKLLSLPITDLLIMVYGKVLEECTQHTTLKSYQKGFTPDFETLIKDARSFIMKELVGKITGKSMNVIGPRMAFYLLIKTFHRGIIAGDMVNKLTKIYDVTIEKLEKEQVVTKDKNMIRLFYLNENEMDYSPDNVDKNNLHQQLCYLSYTIDSRGSDKIPGIISKDNFRVDDLKQVVSLLIKNYNLRQNKGESIIVYEEKEMNILKTLADVMDVKVDDNLDAHM